MELPKKTLNKLNYNNIKEPLSFRKSRVLRKVSSRSPKMKMANELSKTKNTSYYKQHTRELNEKIRIALLDLPEFCESYFRAISSRTSALTRLNYAYDLKLFFEYLSDAKFDSKPMRTISLSDIETVTATDIEKFLDYISLYDRNFNYENKTIVITSENGERGKARKLSSIRSLFKYFFKKEKLSSNVASLVDTPKLHEKAILRLEVDEIERLLDEVETGTRLTERQQALHKNTKKRDLAIITLLLGTGIRVSECVGLNINDVNFDENSIKITRKGGNEVILYISDEVAEVLLAYLEQRNTVEPADDDASSALFLSGQRKRIQQRSIQYLVQKYSKLVTPLKKITPHKLRSTYGTNLYRQSGDIYLVADVLGHRDVNTTKKHYAAMTEDRRKAASHMVKLRNEKNNSETEAE